MENAHSRRIQAVCTHLAGEWCVSPGKVPDLLKTLTLNLITLEQKLMTHVKNGQWNSCDRNLQLLKHLSKNSGLNEVERIADDLADACEAKNRLRSLTLIRRLSQINQEFDVGLKIGK